MTVREAFAKAGHPVPERWKIVPMLGTIGVLAENRDKLGETWVSDWYEFASADTIDGETWMLIHKGQRDTAKVIDLSNLPAVDAYDALPECVQKVVER